MKLPRVTGIAAILLALNVGLAGTVWLLALRVWQAPPNAERGFLAAVADAQDPNREDIHRELVAITTDNPSLLWDGPAGEGNARVLVATWTSYQGYAEKTGAACSLGRDVWVTPVPQFQSFCRRTGLSGKVLGRRLEQYLGLAPSGGRDMVVELWVSKRDLFRPCPDREIDDRECRLGLPDIPEGEVERHLEHARWFASQFKQYYERDAAPWTRLGYTYDWGNPHGKVGASEYVIREGAVVWVGAAVASDAYCRQGDEVRRSAPGDDAPAQASAPPPC